ncbi:MAG: PTS sugar transporter subunit IIA [Sporolactobacillus sp.]
MVTIIVAAHGQLAAAFINTAKMIFGNIEHTKAVTFEPGEGIENLLEKYQDVIHSSEQIPGNEVLFLTDLFGGSPYNAASRFAARQPHMDIVTGVNLPMLIDVLARRMAGGTLADLVSTAKQSGTDGIRSFREWFDKQQIVNSAKAEEGDELG